jgi:cold shock CspA family protein
MNGKVTKIFREKGFLFARGDDSKEYFVHRSQAPDFDGFREGDAITFTPSDTPKGLRAVDVRLA